MEKKKFDDFIEKLSTSIEKSINDYKVFIELQKECVELLEQFNVKSKSDFDGLRRLSYFRLQIRQLFRYYNKEKKETVGLKPLIHWSC